MEAITCIRTRRSIRSFTEQPVPVETIREIISDTSLSPSWKNSQCVRWIAVTDPGLKNTIAEKCVTMWPGNGVVIKAAPVLMVEVIIHGRSGYEKDGTPTTSKGDKWEVYDAGIAAQTFCLSAHAHGLGTVIQGIFDEAVLSQVLGLEDGKIAAALIPMGYPAQEGKLFPRKDVDTLLTVR